MSNVCIVAAKRTPQGRFMGALAKKSAVDLAVAAGRAVLEGFDRSAVEQVIVGNVLSAGLGMSIARQVGVGLGLPIETPAFTVNMMCGSGMQAVLLAAQAIRAGDARCVLCGGAESMSNAPYLLDRARGGYKLGDGIFIDSILRDGLTDPFGHGHMGATVERIAKRYGITRDEQDAFALTSQMRWAAAHEKGIFVDEIVAVDGLDRDEHPRPDSTLGTLASLKPAFDPAGTITAGNASGINDGASMLLLCAEEFADERGLKPMARIIGGVSTGCDPDSVAVGPVYSTNKLCTNLHRDLSSFDLVELNEAFAAQVIACVRDLRLEERKTNIHGGAIALGHPIGASGARIVTHLAHCLNRGMGASALATLCIGGGMGCTIALET